ncbi:chalcone isomerase family protein [Candidatus Latescibacterota bacterium]
MKRNAIIAFLSICILIPSDGYARKLKKVNFPETISVDGSACKLIGVGIRKKLIINVYLGALYLEKPSKNPSQVIKSEQVKRIVMHFLYREVGADQLVEAWNEGFAKNSPGSVATLKNKIATFNSFFTAPIKSGERIIIDYRPGKGTEVKIKGKTAGVIQDKDFMEALFAIWFGPSPPSKGLKKGMLGE